MIPILTARVGNNSEFFRDILSLYVKKEDAKILDVTFGNGSFWREIRIGSRFVVVMDKMYHRVNSQIDKTFRSEWFNRFDHRLCGDMTQLPFRANFFDCIVLDPPYANSSTTHRVDGVGEVYALHTVTGIPHLALYRAAMDEAIRVVVPGGVVVVKCQDEVESAIQNWNHIHIFHYAWRKGLICEDLFVTVQKGRPMMRHKHQVHARKNHSYFLVFKESRKKMISRKNP